MELNHRPGIPPLWHVGGVLDELTKRRSRLEAIGLAAALVLIVIGARHIAAGDQDVADLAWFQDATGLQVGPEAAWFSTGLNGDGGTFVIIAADPFGREIGQMLRHPAYRYTRFGYSWLGSVVVLGQDHMILLGLSLVGLASVAAMAILAVGLHGQRGEWAWLLLLNPALYVGFLYDTAEPLALAVLASLLMFGGIWGPAALAVIRPSYLVALAGKWRLLLIGLVVAGGVRIAWAWWFGDSLTDGLWNLGIPFRGAAEAASPAALAVAAAGAVTTVIGLMRKDWGWLVSGLLVVSMSAVVYDTPINAVRAAGMLPVLWAFGPRYRTEREHVSRRSYPEPGVRPA